MVTTDEAVKAEVLAAANGLCEAITADDWSTIDRTLADELYYRHSNGLFDLKPAYVDKLHLRKRTTWLEDPEVRPYGDVAIVIAGYGIDSTLRDGTAPGRVRARGLQVWNKRDGRWQLVAHQGTAEAKKD